MAPKHLLLNRVHTSWTCLFNLFVNILSGDHRLIADDIKLYIRMGGVMSTDENVVVFPDIKPAAPHHYLIVSKEHILDAKTLGPEHKSLVEKMVETANKILEDKGCNMSDISMGFHWPPFTTISHLHLHAISPQSEMGVASKVAFRPDSMWYVSPQYVLSRL